MGFSLYPWQSTLWQSLLTIISQRRLPHALLCEGRKGLGKADYASGVCHYLFCQQPLPSQPCGACKGCLLFEQGAHPDFYRLSLEQKSTGIKIDQIRVLSEKLSQSSSQRGYRLVIIEPAHKLTLNAANALLKLLEEPGKNTLIFLVTEEASLLPDTLRSRCQCLSFISPQRQLALDWLKKKVAKPVDWNLLLNLSQDAPLLALQLHESGFLKSREQFLNAAFNLSSVDMLTLAEKYFAKDVSVCLEILVGLLSDLLKSAQGVSCQYWQNQDKLEMIKNVAQTLAILPAYELLTKWYELRSQLVNQVSLNHQLLLETILLDWSNLLTVG